MKNGFTLIELTVVLVILSIITLLVLPRLVPGDEAALKSSARRGDSSLVFSGVRLLPRIRAQSRLKISETEMLLGFIG